MTPTDSIKKPVNCNLKPVNNCLENENKGSILSSMKKIAIYPSILALKDSPTSWDEKVSALTVPLSGLHYDI
ncbi:hypothetical protein H6768_06235 [Candidatus Peribacteria bacterium]|nr:hypothetical protein [Candidatus Peribacteria bacterium]